MESEISIMLDKIKTEAEEVIESLIDLTMASPVYAGAFWGFYCDYDVIHPPCFALNTIDRIDSSTIAGTKVKWIPPEWKLDVIDNVTDSLMPSYEKLSDLLRDQDDEVWEDVIEKNYLLYCEICKKLTDRARSNEGNFSRWNKTDDFLILILEEKDGDEMYNWLVESSVSAEILSEIDGILIE